jgi:hypothetical protein
VTLPYQPNNPPPPPQLSEAHLQQLAAARLAAKKLRRASSVANFDGWSLGFFAGLTLLFGITSVDGWIIGLILASIAYIELRGASRLRLLDPVAPRVLGWNQVALASLLILYSFWRIYQESTGKGELASLSGGDPMVAEAVQPYQGMVLQITMLFYVGLIVFAVFAQGGLALYYFTRARTLKYYLEQTPEWILQMQKSGVAF